jgi:glycine/D-amino acid oxidase-like deaminating enzyme
MIVQFRTYNVPEDSPLRLVRPFFWQARVVDDGLIRPTSFYALSQNGQIELCAPARAIGFDDDGGSIVLNNGRKITADVVIIATGYRSSWEDIFDGESI